MPKPTELRRGTRAKLQQRLQEAVEARNADDAAQVLEQIAPAQRAAAGCEALKGVVNMSGDELEFGVRIAAACYPQLQLSVLPREVFRSVARRVAGPVNSEQWRTNCAADVQLAVAWLQATLMPKVPTESVCCGETTCCATWLASPPNLCCWDEAGYDPQRPPRWQSGSFEPQKGAAAGPCTPESEGVLWLVSEAAVRSAVPEGVMELACHRAGLYLPLIELLLPRGRGLDVAELALLADDRDSLRRLSDYSDRSDGSREDWISVAAVFSRMEIKHGKELQTTKEDVLEVCSCQL